METPKLTRRTKETLEYIKLGLRAYVICKLMHVTRTASNQHVKKLVKYYNTIKPWANVLDSHDIFLLENHPEIYFKYKELLAKHNDNIKEHLKRKKEAIPFLPKGNQ